MRICVVGGIFDRVDADSHRGTGRYTPETILVDGLRERGHEIDALGHADFKISPSHELIHVHHVGRAAYLMASTATRTPFVFTAHDGRMLCGQEHNPIRKAAFARIVSRCDAAIALSEAEARFLSAMAHDRVHVVPNGIPDPWTTQEPLRAADGRSGLLFIGQLIPLKGVHTLVRALGMIHRDPPVQLRLVYHVGVEEQALRALARAVGVADQVAFLGPRSPERIAQLVATAEALVLPTFAESLPTVITEALLAGTPVVASAVGGIPEQLGPHARLVSPGEPAELAAAIQAILDTPPDAAARSRMRDYARARYSIRAMIEGHLRLYETLARVGASPRRGRGVLDSVLRFAVASYWRKPRGPVRAQRQAAASGARTLGPCDGCSDWTPVGSMPADLSRREAALGGRH